MPQPMTNAGLAWRPPTLPEDKAAIYLARLDAILAAWKGTPYVPGQQRRGVGADCVRFVAAVLDEFYRRPPTPITTLPADASFHTRIGAIKGMHRIRKLYMPNIAVKDGSLEPGDVIITGPGGGGPGHAMIVGSKKNYIWHATGNNVHRTGLGFTSKVYRVYRMAPQIREAACR